MATEEQNNKALISALSVSNSQANVSTLIVPPPPPYVDAITSITASSQTTDAISTLAQAFPATKLKLIIILKKWNASSISDEVSCEVTRLPPSALTSVVFFSPTSDMEESSDTRAELDSHVNIVALRSDSFVFESTDRRRNIQPFTSNLGIAKNAPIFEGSLASNCPYSG